jgi:membrane associated rhomboid family serine protease
MLSKLPVTFSLIALNVAVFAYLAWQQKSFLMDTNLDVLAILRAGANLNPYTLGGEPWRIVTSMFLHFGVIHLAVNMLALLSLGKGLETILGTPRFILLYLLCGIGSGLASLIFNVYTISAGASGAIFGLYGYRLGMEIMTSLRDRVTLIQTVVNFIIFVAINAFMTVQFNVDLAGHLGGLFSGLALCFFQLRLRLLTDYKQLGIVLLLSPLLLFLLPKDQLRYFNIFQRVVKLERKTNQLFSGELGDWQIRDSLVTIVPGWNTCDSLLRHLGRVPAEIAPDTSTLRQYVGLRRREALYRIAIVERESYIYLDSLEFVELAFDELPPFIKTLNFEIPEERPAPKEKETPDDVDLNLKSRRVFYDASWKQIDDPSEAVYFRVGTVDSLDRWQGPVRDYYRSGEIQMKGRYKNSMKDGVFLYYSDRGTYTSAGRYNEEDAVGKWETFHWNGQLQSEVFYNQGAFTKSVWDSLGRAQVAGGEGSIKRWYNNGQLAEEGRYREGRREGDWYGYHRNGDPYYHELYQDNRLLRGVSVDREGKRYVYDQLSLYPFPVIGMRAYNQYLQTNRRTDDSLTNRSGVVKVIFDVGVDGAIWDFVVIQGLSNRHDEEAIRLIREGPAWRPGLSHGHKKEHSQGYVEVQF